MVRANLYCFRNSVSSNQLIQYQLLPRLLKRDRIVASFGWATSRLGRAPIMDTDYAVDCLPGKTTPFYTSSRRKSCPLQITFAFYFPQQNNEFYRRTCWKEQVRTRLVLDSICKTGVCSRINMFPEKEKASFIGQEHERKTYCFPSPATRQLLSRIEESLHLSFEAQERGNKVQDMRLPFPSILNSRTYQPTAGETDNLTGGPSALSMVLIISLLCPPAAWPIKELCRQPAMQKKTKNKSSESFLQKKLYSKTTYFGTIELGYSITLRLLFSILEGERIRHSYRQIAFNGDERRGNASTVNIFFLLTRSALYTRYIS